MIAPWLARDVGHQFHDARAFLQAVVFANVQHDCFQVFGFFEFHGYYLKPVLAQIQAPRRLRQYLSGTLVPMWQYSQSSGALLHDSVPFAVGYSGLGLDKDEPDDEGVVGMGPIPQGQWMIGPPADSPTLGPHVMPLLPAVGTDALGRSGFFIHGDSLTHPGQASHGCIVLDRTAREAISASGDTTLTVTA
jgi:Protein of unknown function (DUF2778)